MTEANTAAPNQPANQPAEINVSELGIADFMSMSSDKLNDLIKQVSTAESQIAATAVKPEPKPAIQQDAGTQQVQDTSKLATNIPENVNTPESKPKTPEQVLEEEIAKVMGHGQKDQPKPAEQPPAQSGSDEETDPNEQMVKDPDTGKVVPLSALLSERREKADLREEVATLKGQLQALMAGKPAAQPEAPKEKTPEEKINELRSYAKNARANYQKESDKLAQRYEDGDITFSQYNQYINQLRSKTDDINDLINEKISDLRVTASRPSPDAEKYIIDNDPLLSASTRILIDKNPWISNIPDAAFNNLVDAATARMQQLGLKVDNTPQSVLNLRQAMVNIGLEFNYDKAFAPAPTAASTQPSADQPNTQITPQQRAEKLRLQNSHPPSLPTAGTRADAQPGATANSLDNMTPMEIANALPRETLSKLAFGPYAT